MQPATIITNNPTTIAHVKCVCELNGVDYAVNDEGICINNPTNEVYDRIAAYIRTGNQIAKMKAERIERGLNGRIL